MEGPPPGDGHGRRGSNFSDLSSAVRGFLVTWLSTIAIKIFQQMKHDGTAVNVCEREVTKRLIVWVFGTLAHQVNRVYNQDERSALSLGFKVS